MKTYICDATHVYVNILFQKENEQIEVYELKDDNPCFTFSNILFLESLVDFQNLKTDIARPVPPKELHKRMLLLHKKVNIDSRTNLKLTRAIKYIEKNIDRYIGIQTIF